MSDEPLLSLLSTGGGVVGGGGIVAVVVRALFRSFAQRLDKIDAVLEQLVAKSDARHERLIERLTTVEAAASAAHRRLDEMSKRGRR